jgi:hypothetical protein
MKLGDICSAPCFARASEFTIPAAGCSQNELEFGHEDGRRYFAVLLRNHDMRRSVALNPKVAIVGLSPAANQIDEFVDTYRKSGDYGTASIAGAFASLAPDIIRMFKGLGMADKLGLVFPDLNTLAMHPDVYVTSLVACASLTTDGSSDDFDPNLLPAARRCMVDRFAREMLNPDFMRLSYIVILGAKGWSAIKSVRMSDNLSLLEHLQKQGKRVFNLPHPSGQNREYVNLASLPAEHAPTRDNYVSERWVEYLLKPTKPGKRKQAESKYRKRRETVWRTIDELRREIASMEAV